MKKEVYMMRAEKNGGKQIGDYDALGKEVGDEKMHRFNCFRRALNKPRCMLGDRLHERTNY